MCQKEPHELMAAEFLLGQPLGKLSDLREMRVKDHAFGFGRRACPPRQKKRLDLGFHGTRGGCDRLVAPARHRWGSLWATSWKVALGPHRCGRSVHVDSTVTEIPPFVKNWQGRP